MRRRPGVLVLVAVLAGCGDGNGIAAFTGEVSFEPAILDFGVVHIGETAQRATTLNAGGYSGAVIRELRFESADYLARTGLGQTLRGTEVPPGGVIPVEVVFGPSVEGDASSALVVVIEDGEARLDLKAVARARLPADPAVEPGSVGFGPVELGRTVVQRFSIKNLGEIPAALLEVRPKSASDVAPFAVTAVGGGAAVPSRALLGLGADALELEVRFAPTRLGAFSRDLELVFEGGETAVLSVTGQGVPAGTLACEPMGIDFGVVTRGESPVRSVRCVVSGGVYNLASLALGAASSSLFRPTQVPTGVSPSGTLDFDVVFDARGVAGEHRGTIEIVALSGAVTRIPLEGAVTPPAPGITDVKLLLQWSTDGTDFDLHFVRSNGLPFDARDDCYFAAKSPDWGSPNDPSDDPFLDRDETEGFGPEEINLATAEEDVFDVYVHYFNFEAMRAPSTNVSVTLSSRGVELGRFRQILDACGATWHVGRLRFDASGTPTFTADTVVTSVYRNRAAARCQ